MTSVLFLIIHGVQSGKQSDSYAAEFIDAIQRKIPDSSNISFRSINWGKLVEARQDQVYKRISANHRFWLRPILKLMSTVLSDLIWYLLTMVGKDRSSLEAQIDAMVRAEIEIFRSIHPKGLIIIGGHSLGSQIGLKLCYDTFRVHGLITWGTFCYYLSGGYPDWGYPPPINFWVNFFNPADPVATTMKENDNFKEFVTVIPINNYLKVTPILAHTMYWKSDKMISTIAEILQNPESQKTSAKLR